MSVCILKLSSGQGEVRTERMLCCWSPQFPFACLSDVSLGWVPQSDSGDKMMGVWVQGCTCHWMPIWLQSTVSTEAPTDHENKKRTEARSMVRPNHIFTENLQCHNTHTCSDTVNTAWQPAMLAATTWHLIHHPKRLCCYDEMVMSASEHRLTVLLILTDLVCSQSFSLIAYCLDMMGRIREGF